jgi:riboflavin synthase
MFTGLVECRGVVAEFVPQSPGCRLVIGQVPWAGEAALGDSVAVNGCCLTVVEVGPQTLAFEAGPETLARTNLGALERGSPANLERSLRIGDRLGGHCHER